MSGDDDAEVLVWAAENRRIVLTHDRATMPAAAYARVATGLPMPGMFVVSDRVSSGGVIDDLLLIDACCEQAEWDGLVLYLPLATARP